MISVVPNKQNFFLQPFAGGMPPFSEEVWVDYNPSRIGVKELDGDKFTSTSARARMRYVPGWLDCGGLLRLR